MTAQSTYPDYQETFEYHGNTAIEHTRRQDGRIEREWILFDSAEEAVAFFHEVSA